MSPTRFGVGCLHLRIESSPFTESVSHSVLQFSLPEIGPISPQLNSRFGNFNSSATDVFQQPVFRPSRFAVPRDHDRADRQKSPRRKVLVFGIPAERCEFPASKYQYHFVSDRVGRGRLSYGLLSVKTVNSGGQKNRTGKKVMPSPWLT